MFSRTIRTGSSIAGPITTVKAISGLVKAVTATSGEALEFRTGVVKTISAVCGLVRFAVRLTPNITMKITAKKVAPGPIIKRITPGLSSITLPCEANITAMTSTEFLNRTPKKWPRPVS